MIRVTKPTNATSILNSMKTHQTAFNGSGAQEATDQLFVALIHPLMPARFVCQNDDLFDRLLDAVISYDKSRNDLLTPSLLPYVSGKKPIYMNHSGHTIYMRHVLCFKRTDVIFNAQRLQKAHELNLFQPNAIMQPDGRGVGETLWSAVVGILNAECLPQYHVAQFQRLYQLELRFASTPTALNRLQEFRTSSSASPGGPISRLILLSLRGLTRAGMLR
ncbi:hypothetical protein B0H14DRAFT_3474170 [Mycena olivaceomarginata]|nr:hypothetical protein B0H14DRAFT_3474170 [Mycena olivaceomarginata]